MPEFGTAAVGLTSWSRVLPEKLTVVLLLKKGIALYGSQNSLP
jgi:hypothetical protein